VPLSEDFAERYGPTAVVTGASSGIGEHFARLLAAQGIDLVLVARRIERLVALSDALRDEHGVDAETLPLDLSRSDFLEPLLALCEDRNVGLIVSNAGIGAKGPHHRTAPQKIDEMLAVNCRAPLLLAHAFAPRLMERGRGGFLITGSIEGFQGFPYSASYAASKALVLSFGQGLWGELREHGVDVLVLSPGPTDTELLPNSGINPDDMSGLMSPEQVARGALEQLGSGPVFIPGLRNRMLIRFLSALPRRAAVIAAGKGMRAAVEKGYREPRAR
jgi:short-subunit dehydrogenase